MDCWRCRGCVVGWIGMGREGVVCKGEEEDCISRVIVE